MHGCVCFVRFKDKLAILEKKKLIMASSFLALSLAFSSSGVKKHSKGEHLIIPGVGVGVGVESTHVTVDLALCWSEGLNSLNGCKAIHDTVLFAW